MKRPNTHSGFTLIELMLVVSIITLMAAAAAPSFGASMADGRTANLSEDLVRIGRRARSEPMGTGSAHRLTYSRVDDLGTLNLFRGDSNQCNLVTSWTQIDRVDAKDFTGDINASERNSTHIIDFSPNEAALQNVEICYQPSGITLLRINSGSMFSEGVVSGGVGIFNVLYKVTRTLNGAQRGVIRYVLFPYGGNARIQRIAE